MTFLERVRAWHDPVSMINYSGDISRRKGSQNRVHDTVFFSWPYEKHHLGSFKTEEKCKLYNCHSLLWHIFISKATNLILLASGGFEPCEMCYNMICETRNRTEMYDIYPFYNPSGADAESLMNISSVKIG